MVEEETGAIVERGTLYYQELGDESIASSGARLRTDPQKTLALPCSTSTNKGRGCVSNLQIQCADHIYTALFLYLSVLSRSALSPHSTW